ncbi:bifunctional phosphoribosylaminoimidazolecarboxamide formyltransferase/IMP cyclohydrolase [Hymenobacter taeanensis]|uniref:Bifunctional purine biosynthesis protein PurH n=1 Tax=Hymenobacter taeanensis TaxID=2735321 RepID=A0A6M6BJK7_9BACT|nr:MULTISPECIES: bifunctional phosphoribosylaminoimidazolecarboxamide formyltransferase/IMP cyclohydrolase [Hymenobacter]QJX47255.1 bifunctional phosphoribosylaminoimidazolecarboxamide formyltransferase/IMP cyclohydrolase [Hymenobacter taeanensis]UOQ79409.1 bifunctional phosphoribosylaminoimidazolecarboxamide formyltransferase/IMP cyclohydrolase [Hymenobacter sp. 5414T-23]
MSSQPIRSALISVYYKDRLESLVALLKQHGVTIYSTGGTQQFIEEQGAPVTAVESLTGFPAVFGGRVKTLHPTVFGGILHRRHEASDLAEAEQHQIPPIDLVVVDLYPFEETVASGAAEQDVIEKIDIGGISLLRAAAKNFRDVLVVSSRDQYAAVTELLTTKNCATDLEDRRHYAAAAFEATSHYDTQIFRYMAQGTELSGAALKISEKPATPLRYGENPHQAGIFYGDLSALFDQLHGKQLSYNNLVDVDAAVLLMQEFTEGPAACAILKHTNACGVAQASTLKEAYLNALACDPISAFGGVLIVNQPVDAATAEELNKLFFEVLIAPEFAEEALPILQSKKNRILLRQKPVNFPAKQVKTLLNGVIEQDFDRVIEGANEFRTVTESVPTAAEVEALEFANKVCKHTKSNTIVLARAGQLLASGVGQTSRVDALKQAIEKARTFGFDLKGAVMASDAFFPFPDCVEIAGEAGIRAVVQPGGSIKDADSIAACNQLGMAMVMTGVRHFKH